MPNKNPNMEGILPHRFTSDSALAASKRSAIARQLPPTDKVTINISSVQHAELKRRGVKLSALVRSLLDDYLSR